jgi:hypothetical protein
MLQHRRDALEAHPGIDRGLGQRMHDAVLVAVELHEDVVPDLDVAVAVLVGRAGRAAGNLRAVVVEDLGAGAAGAGVAHHPEVVGSVARALVVADTDAALHRHADLFGPDVVGLVVLGIHRDPELVRRQLVDIDQQFPGVLDGVALEIIAEAEVAQHLEEGVVARGVADVFQVVVLAAGAHAFLRGGGAVVAALVEAEKDILELVHPGVGEQQRGVVVRHQRAGGHDLVAFRGEEVEELLADFGAFHGGARPWTQRCDFTRTCLIPPGNTVSASGGGGSQPDNAVRGCAPRTRPARGYRPRLNAADIKKPARGGLLRHGTGLLLRGRGVLLAIVIEVALFVMLFVLDLLALLVSVLSSTSRAPWP